MSSRDGSTAAGWRARWCCLAVPHRSSAARRWFCRPRSTKQTRRPIDRFPKRRSTLRCSTEIPIASDAPPRPTSRGFHRFTSATMDAISSPPPHSISLGGLRTSAPVRAAPPSWGRHPKTFTEAAVRQMSALGQKRTNAPRLRASAIMPSSRATRASVLKIICPPPQEASCNRISRKTDIDPSAHPAATTCTLRAS